MAFISRQSREFHSAPAEDAIERSARSSLRRLGRLIVTSGVAIVLVSIASLRASMPAAGRDTGDEPGIRTDTIVSDLAMPTSFAFGPGERIYIAERGGRVLVAVNETLEPEPFIDLSPEVNNTWDRGLLAIALHPDFPDPPYLYLLYSYDPPGTVQDSGAARVSRLLRVEADRDNLNVAASSSASRTVILGTASVITSIPEAFGLDPYLAPTCAMTETGGMIRDCLPGDAATHSIGGLAFASDGSLYVSVGDASWASETDPRRFRAQDLDSLAGKVLRINPVTGEGYSDNPFFDGDLNSNRSKVVAYGLRNPFRFSLHPVTGELLIGDVGFNTWEELNIGHARNFGWPCYEGGPNGSLAFGFSITTTACDAMYGLGVGAVQTPALAYDHAYGSAIIAGPILSGTSYPGVSPEEMAIGDFDLGWIRLVSVTQDGRASIRDWLSTPPDIGGITQMQVGPDGMLYYSFYRPLAPDGEIRRIRFGLPYNHAPLVYAQVMPDPSGTPRTAFLTSYGTRDPEGEPLTYTWSLGNGLMADGPSAYATFATDGRYTATLVVTDTAGSSASRSVPVSIASVPKLTILTPTIPATFTAESPIEYAGLAWDPTDGYVSESIHWRADLYHETHVHAGIHSAIGAAGVFTAPAHGGNAWIMLCAAAPDSNGFLGTQRCVAIFDTRAYPFYFPVARR